MKTSKAKITTPQTEPDKKLAINALASLCRIIKRLERSKPKLIRLRLELDDATAAYFRRKVAEIASHYKVSRPVACSAFIEWLMIRSDRVKGGAR